MIAKTSLETDATTFPSVIFVDLDDTLVMTDLLAESIVKAAKQCPWQLLRSPFALLNGRAAFKSALAQHVLPDASLLPYRRDVLELLKRHRDAGVKLVLATASPRCWA